MNILNQIFTHKRQELARRLEERPLSFVKAAAGQATPPLDFLAAMRASQPLSTTEKADVHYSPLATRTPALIAEVKHASPSRGVLCTDFDPLHLARLFRQNGAAAISVLTDERFFQGSLEHLFAIAGDGPHLPLLRKDFLFDEYQVWEARAAGADALLLITAVLEPERLRALHALTLRLGMTPLVEIHDEQDLEVALTCDPVLVGINNRDLRSFSVSLDTTLRLRPLVPPNIRLVSESGIHTSSDVCYLSAAGVDAVLVGESLVTAPDVGAKVRELVMRDQ